MGERQSDGGLTGRRRVHPADPAPDAAFEALLAAFLRAGQVDGEAERRAVHAFREARDTGAHRARTRRRDDWRPRSRGFPGRSLKTALSVLLAGFALGGVAFAAIGGTDSASRGADDERRPTGSVTDGSQQQGADSAGSASPSASAASDGPETAQDTEARCRAYEQLKERGKAMEATAWQRLVATAGGEKKVDDYCDRKLAEAKAEARTTPSSSNVPEVPATSAAPEIPVNPTTRAPVDPTPAAPTAADRDRATEDAGRTGGGDDKPQN